MGDVAWKVALPRGFSFKLTLKIYYFYLEVYKILRIFIL